MPRIKDDHKNHNHVLEGLSPEMKAFNEELAALFPDIRYTSGKRNASEKFSHHENGDALDFGAENKKVYDHLIGTKEGLQLLTKYNLGIIDETSPEMMKKTGATGPHFHIGKDSKYAKQAQELFMNFNTNTVTPLSQKEIVPIQIVVPQQGVLQSVSIDPNTLTEVVESAKEREQTIEKKIEESPERQQIRKKQEERQAILNMAKPLETVEYFSEENSDNGIPISQIEIQPIQTQLKDLPAIFDLPQIV